MAFEVRAATLLAKAPDTGLKALLSVFRVSGVILEAVNGKRPKQIRAQNRKGERLCHQQSVVGSSCRCATRLKADITSALKFRLELRAFGFSVL